MIIVGAGPAGCSAATFLKRNGYTVLVVDRERFPRDKACGDGLSPPAIDILERMGVTEKIERLNPWRIDGVEFISPAGKKLRTEFRCVEGIRDHSYVLPRRDLDFVLFQHLRENSNADVVERCNVMDLTYEGDDVSGIRVDTEDGPQKFIGKVIVGADGVHSVIARRFFSLNRDPRHMVLAVRAYFEKVDGLDRFIEIHCEKAILPGYGWVFPTGKDSANVGVGTSCRVALGKKDVMRMFDTFLKRNRLMKERFNRTRMRENSFRAWLIPLGSRRFQRSRENVLLIGDAGSFADTLSGEGIYHALRSGEYAAEAIDIGLGTNPKTIGETFENLWKREFKAKEYALGHLIQRFVFSEHFLNFNIKRAIKNRKMAERLVEILCYKKSKLRLLF
ncbi:MAG: geranylgeranyl reductase family protein [Proteobacteria bacterium]|nr:geranylgeranyl reductase family protein [Pseudomonadota bacterium]